MIGPLRCFCFVIYSMKQQRLIKRNFIYILDACFMLMSRALRLHQLGTAFESE